MACWIPCVWIAVYSLYLEEARAHPIIEGYVPCDSNDSWIPIPSHLRPLVNVTNLCLTRNLIMENKTECVLRPNLQFAPPKSPIMSNASIALICIITFNAICVFVLLFKDRLQAIIKRLRK